MYFQMGFFVQSILHDRYIDVKGHETIIRKHINFLKNTTVYSNFGFFEELSGLIFL